MLEIRGLSESECSRIKEIDASQYINKAWRLVNGKKKLVNIDYYDPDWPNGFEKHLDGLRRTLKNDGLVMGAFKNDCLVGVVSLNRQSFGKGPEYVLLDQLFISKEFRNNGIGKRLFMNAIEIAKTWNIDKIYICAGSAEETIGFYRSIGCSDAEVVNQALFEEDPRDVHLEYDLFLIDGKK